MHISKCVNLNNVGIPYCMSNDFPRTILNCAYYGHVFWTIPFVRISEFSSQKHQIDCISKLQGIWEGMSTTCNWMLEPTWLNLNDICFSTSLGKPKWLNCRRVIRHVQWQLANGGNMCQIGSNNRCWSITKKTRKEIAHPLTYVWKVIIQNRKWLWEAKRYLIGGMKPSPLLVHWQT